MELSTVKHIIIRAFDAKKSARKSFKYMIIELVFKKTVAFWLRTEPRIQVAVKSW
ncbi:hypothetical protein Plhal304r1_c052g0136731 [Plasmopara halstedii]